MREPPIQSGTFSKSLGIGRSFGTASNRRDNARRGEAFQKGASVTRFDQPAGVPDAAEILRSIGDVAYEWRLDSDALTWSGNAATVLGLADTAEIASGQAYAKRIDDEGGRSRVDALQQAGQHDAGDGVPYQVQYALKRGDAAEKLWLEDTGRWFAGPDGKPLRAIGIEPRRTGIAAVKAKI